MDFDELIDYGGSSDDDFNFDPSQSFEGSTSANNQKTVPLSEKLPEGKEAVAAKNTSFDYEECTAFKACSKSTKLSPYETDLYGLGLKMMKDSQDHNNKQTTGLLDELLPNYNKVQSTIALSVVDYYKKIDKYRTELLSSYTNAGSFEPIELKDDHKACDPYAELFHDTICSDINADKSKFLNIINILHQEKQESFSSNTASIENDDFGSLSADDIWSHRTLYLHQFVAALMQNHHVGLHLNGCPLSLNFDFQSLNTFRTRPGKDGIYYPKLSSVIAGLRRPDCCNYSCSCSCTEEKDDFCTLFFGSKYSTFEDYWKCKRDSFCKKNDQDTLEHHLQFGDVLNDLQSCPFMEGKVGTNTFNIMHHMIHDCARLVFTWYVARKEMGSMSTSTHEELIDKGIVLDKTKKTLKWRKFMYDLPTRSMIEKYATPDECCKAIEAENKEHLLKNEFFLGGYSDVFDLLYDTKHRLDEPNSNISSSKIDSSTEVAVSTSDSSEKNPMCRGLSVFLHNTATSSTSVSRSRVSNSTPKISSSTSSIKSEKKGKALISNSKSRDVNLKQKSVLDKAVVSKQTSVSSSVPISKSSNRPTNNDYSVKVRNNEKFSQYHRNDQKRSSLNSFHLPNDKNCNQSFRSFDYHGRGSGNSFHHSPRTDYDRSHSYHSTRTSRNCYGRGNNHRNVSRGRLEREYSCYHGDYHHNYRGVDNKRRFNMPSDCDDTRHPSDRSYSRKSFREESNRNNETPFTKPSGDRRDSFSSSISNSPSSSSKRLKPSDSSTISQDATLKLSSDQPGKKSSVMKVDSKDKATDVNVVDIDTNIKMLSFPDGSRQFLDTKNVAFIPDPVTVVATKNALNKSHVSLKSIPHNNKTIPSNRKVKPSKNNAASAKQSTVTNTLPYPHEMNGKQQKLQMMALNGLYPKEDRTNIVLEDLGDLNSYKRRRDTYILKCVSESGLFVTDKFYDKLVILKELNSFNSNSNLHFGKVVRAIGLNRQNIFFWKVSFGDKNIYNHQFDDIYKSFNGYQHSSIVWNAVVTHEELEEIISATHTKKPELFVVLSNVPKRDNNKQVNRPIFVDSSSNNVDGNLLYSRSSSPSTVMDCVNDITTSLSFCKGRESFLHSEAKDHISLDEVHNSIVDSAAYAVCNSNVCFGSLSSTKRRNKSCKSGSRICCVCGSSIISNSHSLKGSETVAKFFPENPLAKNISLDYIHICTKCICDSIQSFKYVSRNAHLMQCLNATILHSHVSWGCIQHCFFRKCWHKYFPDASRELKEDVSFQQLVGCTISFRLIDVTKLPWMMNRNKKNDSELKRNIEGAMFVEGQDFSPYIKKALSLPTDVDFGIILLPENDFLFICNSDFRNIDSVYMSLCQTSIIKKLKSYGRAGAAGGIVSTETNSHSMTDNTRKDGNLFVPSKKGVGISCIYQNKNRKLKSFSGVYNDVYMDRFGIADKITKVQENISYARISLAEMKSRTKSLILAAELGLLSDAEIAESFLFLQKKDIIWSKSTRSYSHTSKVFSRFDMLLLHQVCTTGEMRNHQALHAHVDGNKSHFMESLALFGRINVEDIYREEELSNVVNNMTAGYLYLPLCGIVLSLPCCTVSVHCRLKKTVHIPDLSRNIHNWSKVHGPSGSWIVKDISNVKRQKEVEWFENTISKLKLR